MLTPDQRQFQRDLELDDFQAGVASSAWRLIALRWPHALFAVTAGDGRELGLRLELTEYPAAAPAGEPWDLTADTVLATERWPRIGAQTFPFRPEWSPFSSNAPYIAADRFALASHPNWIAEHPERIWNSRRTVTFYLAELHRELRSAGLPQTI